jgi:O-antigen/teichoic acid export membrane protein
MGLSRQVAIVAVGRVATTASIFVVNALLARAWSLADFGRFSAIWILGNTLVPVFLLGIPTALLYAFPRRQTEVERRLLIRQASAILAGSALVLMALLWLAGGPLSRWLSPAAATDLLIPFLPYVFSVVAAGHVEAALVASGRSTWQAWLSVGGALGLVAAAGLAWQTGWSVADTLWALSTVGAARCVVGWVLLALGPGGVGLPATTGVRSLLGYAGRIGLNDAVGSMSRAVDRVVVLTFLGTADLALYHVGAIEVPVSLMLAAVVTVLVPEVSRLSAAGKHDAVAQLFRGAVGRLSLFILPLFCFLFVHAPTVIEVYLPATYSRADEVFRIFLLALPLRCAVYNPVLVGMGRANWALYGSLGDLLLNAALSVMLVQALLPAQAQWALLGPAAATMLATWCQVVVLVALVARTLGQSWSQILPWGRLGRVSVVSAAAALVSATIVHFFQLPPILRLAVAVAVFAPLSMVALRYWHRPDWDELAGIGAAVNRRETSS